MSLHTSVISIEGDHLSAVPDILTNCEYVIEKSLIVPTAAEASEALKWNPSVDRIAKIAYLSNGWTFIIDSEMVLTMEAIWSELSGKWDNRILGWVCEGGSGSYGLTLFERGNKRRDIMAVAGQVETDEGEPLAEEEGINWTEAWEDDVLAIDGRLGAEYDYLAEREYTVFHLCEPEEYDSLD